MTFPSLLQEVAAAIGIAVSAAGLMRIDEVVVFCRSQSSLATELLRVRAEKRAALSTMEAQHTGMEALQDGFNGLQRKIASLEAEQAQMKGLIASLQPMFDGAIAYIHALTAWGLRLVRALKANDISVGIDENLPKPPDVLLKYVPDEHRPPDL